MKARICPVCAATHLGARNVCDRCRALPAFVVVAQTGQGACSWGPFLGPHAHRRAELFASCFRSEARAIVSPLLPAVVGAAPGVDEVSE